jgi:hypothetical protein
VREIVEAFLLNAARERGIDAELYDSTFTVSDADRFAAVAERYGARFAGDEVALEINTHYAPPTRAAGELHQLLEDMNGDRPVVLACHWRMR